MQAGSYDPGAYAQAHEHVPVEGYEQGGAGAMPDQVAQGLYGQPHHGGYAHEVAAVNGQQQPQPVQHDSYTAQVTGEVEPDKRQRVE